MSVRAEQKEQTRRSIMMAALTSLSADRSYESLSLREVARLADIAPTSFYRHFKDLEDLGAQLAREAGETLRELIQKAPLNLTEDSAPLESAINLFLQYVQKEPHKFRFIMRERSGSSPAIRKEIKLIHQALVDDLAQWLYRLDQQQKTLGMTKVTWIAEAAVTLSLTMGEVYLDSPEDELPYVYERFLGQIKLLVAGARAQDEAGGLRQ